MPRNARESRGREGKLGTRGKATHPSCDERNPREPTASRQGRAAASGGRTAGGYLKPSRERAFWMAASVMLLPLSIWASSVMRSSGVSWRMVLVVPSAVSVFSTL